MCVGFDGYKLYIYTMKNYTKLVIVVLVVLGPMRIVNWDIQEPSKQVYTIMPDICFMELEMDPLSSTFQSYLYWLEYQHNLPEGLLYVVMMKESSGNPNAVSSAGAQGLFQFMPNTSSWLQIDPFDPYEAASGAARYLQYLIDYFGGNIELGLAAYNAGMGNVRKYGNTIPPFQETQQYVAYVTYRINY